MKALKSDNRIDDGVIDQPKVDGPKLKFSFLRRGGFSFILRDPDLQKVSRPEPLSFKSTLYQKHYLLLPSRGPSYYSSTRIL